MFHEGQLIMYKNGDNVEIGKIKILFEDAAFVWYHVEETAARTRLEDMHPISNAYCIVETIFGGEHRKDHV